MAILYPVISDPPSSDGSVHRIIALLYVVYCTDTVSGALGGSSKLCLVYEHKLHCISNLQV